MDKPDLKPCPFCGGKAEIINMAGNKFTISCGTGGCMANISWCASVESAVNKWNRRMSGWIPCSERMPPTGTRVYVREGEFTVIGFFGKYTQRWIEPISGEHLDNVTHWMPLPEPPEGREEDEDA